MANKQIKDYANLALADTDSLIKQSVAGLTGKTTIADLKANLDGRYHGKGTVVWEDVSGANHIYGTTFSEGNIYEFWLGTQERHTIIVNVRFGNLQIQIEDFIFGVFEYRDGSVSETLKTYMFYDHSIHFYSRLLDGSSDTNEDAVKVFKIIDLGYVGLGESL